MEGKLEPEQTPQVESVKPMSAPSGVLRILFQPREVFTSVQTKANWLLPFIILIVLTLVATIVLSPTIKTEVLNNIASNPDISEEQRAQVVEQVSGGLTLPAIMIPGLLYEILAFFVIAAVFFFVASIMFGAEGKFVQMMSITGLALMVSVPETIVKLPMMLARQTMKVHTDLALFLPLSMEKSFVYSLLGHIDIFSIWKVYLIGLGMAVVFKFAQKKSLTASFVVWGIYVLVASALGRFLNFGMG
jgi:hypothetical protein